MSLHDFITLNRKELIARTRSKDLRAGQVLHVPIGSELQVVHERPIVSGELTSAI